MVKPAVSRVGGAEAPPRLGRSGLGCVSLDDRAALVEAATRANQVRDHGRRTTGAGHHVGGAHLVVIGSAHVALTAAQTSFRNGHEDYSFLIFSSRLLSSASGDKRGSRGLSPPGWLPAGSGGLAAGLSVGKSERRGNIGSSKIRNSRTKSSRAIS